MADIISGKSRFNGDKNAKVVRLTLPQQEPMPDEDDIAGQETQVGSESAEAADVKNKLKKHKLKKLSIIAGAFILLLIVVIIVVNALDVITYSTYSVTKSVNRDDSESTQYVSYGGGYVRYSNDGIAYFNKNGTAIWNQTYSMQKPQVKMCGDVIAVGDINGSTIYVFDKSGLKGSVDTSLAISQIEVAKQGVVAAVLEDNDANYINLYNADGGQIYSVKTSLSGDGYPIDVDISEDATKLMASYLYVSGESIKTNVVFYNFSEVGKNETERIVGGFNHYDSAIVGDVKFVNKTTAIAIGENVMSIYNIKEYPKLAKEIAIDTEIQRVFFSDSYIGIVQNNTNSEEIYKMVIYNLSGGKVSETTFSTQYENISFDGNSIIMNNNSTFVLLNIKCKKLAEITMDLPIEYVLSAGSRGSYTMVNSKYVQSVRLH